MAGMDTVKSILAWVLILGFALIPILFVVRLCVAIFSSRLRGIIRKRWVFHLFWGLCSIFAVLLVLDGSDSRPSEEGPGSHTFMLMSEVQAGILNYQTEYGVFPEWKDPAALTKILLGDNPRQMAFLTIKASAMNNQGELLDEWGTPLRIRITRSQQLWIQSAGPDGKWGTTDDLFLANPDVVER
jgi:hypothetical protein